MKKLLLICVIVLLFVGCSSDTVEVVPNDEITTEQWNRFLDSSQDTIVNVAYFERNPSINDYLEEDYQKDIKIKYGIDLRFELLSLDQLVSVMKKSSMANETAEYDLIYLTDNTFKILKNNGLLYPDVLKKLPNYYTNVNDDDYIFRIIDGIENDDYAVPIYKNQLVFIHNEDIIYETPKTYEGFMTLAKENKGKVTYIHPNHPIGEAFLMSVVTAFSDYENLNALNPNRDLVYNEIKPAIEYLIELDQYLYNSGDSYIRSISEMDSKYVNDELLLTMTLDYNKATEEIVDTNFPKASNTFVIEEGTTGFIDYMAVASTSDNKSGALVVLNDILSGETQSNFYANLSLSKLPIVDHQRMPTNELQHLRDVDVKFSSMEYDDLSESFVPEINKEIREIIIELWSEYVE